MEAIKRFSGKHDFLSNFYPCIVEYEGMKYPSVEHAFQAAKTFDTEVRKGFQVCPTPADAKGYGRKVKLRPDWDDVRVSIMYQLVLDKFSRNIASTDLKSRLIETGDAYLEEGNSHGDRFWGTVKGKGQNQLGLTLMKVRDKLKEV